MRTISVALLLAAVLCFGSASPAQAAPKRGRVVWTEVTVGAHDTRRDLERFLKRIVESQAKRTDWGPHAKTPLEARLEVSQFAVVRTKDVVRVTCTGTGALRDGPTVRSHFSMGGRPAGQAELERRVLTMLGRGIVGRLAQIARSSG